MKLPKFLLSVPAMYFLFLMFGTQAAGCQKTVTVHDTTRTTDTLRVTDTVNSSNYNLNEGLIAFYNFNGGNLNDSSGFHNNIIFNNATPTTDRFGKANGAYLFNGSSSYMEVANSASLNPDSITIFAIVKVNGFYSGPCANNDILIKGSAYEENGIYNLTFADPNGDCSSFDMNSESFSGSYGNDIPVGVSAYSTADTVKVTTGQWYSIAYTYDRNYANLYINGQLKNVRGIQVPSNANADDLYIGMDMDPGYPFPFNGVIDEIRIYNKALCAGAIKQLSTQTK